MPSFSRQQARHGTEMRRPDSGGGTWPGRDRGWRSSGPLPGRTNTEAAWTADQGATSDSRLDLAVESRSGRASVTVTEPCRRRTSAAPSPPRTVRRGRCRCEAGWRGDRGPDQRAGGWRMTRPRLRVLAYPPWGCVGGRHDVRAARRRARRRRRPAGADRSRQRRVASDSHCTPNSSRDERPQAIRLNRAIVIPFSSSRSGRMPAKRSRCGVARCASSFSADSQFS